MKPATPFSSWIQKRRPAAVQRARADQSLELGQVTFANNNRIAFRLLQHNRVIADTFGSARRTRTVDDGFETNSRIYAVNLDGTNLTQLYDPSALGVTYIDAGVVSDCRAMKTTFCSSCRLSAALSCAR
jgi:hypothetical protein